MSEMNDIEYRLILPIYDNSGRKIKPDLLTEAAEEMSIHFGGITVHPHVIGCYMEKDEKTQEINLKCDENTIFFAVREDGLDNEEQRKEDEEFMKKLAKKYGKKFGQESVFYGTDVVEVSFIPGKKKKRLPEEALGYNILKRYL